MLRKRDKMLNVACIDLLPSAFVGQLSRKYGVSEWYFKSLQISWVWLKKVKKSCNFRGVGEGGYGF
jgi:hypothetical protein